MLRGGAWMSQERSKWFVNGLAYFKMAYIGVITHFLSFDPNSLKHPRMLKTQRPKVTI